MSEQDPQSIADILTSGATGSVRSATTGAIRNGRETVDNENFSYYISVVFLPFAGGHIVTLKNVRIKYTIDRPY